MALVIWQLVKDAISTFFVISVLLVSTQGDEHISNRVKKSPENNRHSAFLLKWPSVHFNLSWSVEKTENHGNAIIFETLVDPKVNWIGFGFVVEGDDSEAQPVADADWFIAWKDSKHHVHFKDCYAVEDSLHFDKSQDYHLITKVMPTTLSLRVRRTVDTEDDNDAIIKAGKMNLIWAFGQETKFSRIRSRIQRADDEQEVIIIPDSDETESNLDTADQHQQASTADVMLTEPNNKISNTADTDEDTHSSKSEILENENEDGGDVDLSPVAVNDSLKAEEYLNKRKKFHKASKAKKTKLQKAQLPKFNASVLLPVGGRNCTVIIKKYSNWYEMMKMKENSVYYAIIGSAAIVTGFIVIAIACCCARKYPRSAASKVAFYKVDDYDDEQVEFLKERA